MLMTMIIMPTSSIKDDADEVISDQPTQCAMHSNMFMSACVLEKPEW